ncbi:DUF7239 family protein [Streptomyces anulatus]|uniref:DUF7239 family protein n=1 Tax=Streptomyces anulatus TaxID=1892 RepID=UPI00341DD8FD
MTDDHDDHRAFDDPRLEKQPAWVQNGVIALNGHVRYLRRELEQLRARVNAGPEDSNTFLTDTSGDDPEDSGRPLGRNASIEFRTLAPEARYPHVFDVRLMDDGALRIEFTDDLRIEPLAANELLLRRLE